MYVVHPWAKAPARKRGPGKAGSELSEVQKVKVYAKHVSQWPIVSIFLGEPVDVGAKPERHVSDWGCEQCLNTILHCLTKD